MRPRVVIPVIVIVFAVVSLLSYSCRPDCLRYEIYELESNSMRKLLAEGTKSSDGYC